MSSLYCLFGLSSLKTVFTLLSPRAECKAECLLSLFKALGSITSTKGRATKITLLSPLFDTVLLYFLVNGLG